MLVWFMFLFTSLGAIFFGLEKPDSWGGLATVSWLLLLIWGTIQLETLNQEIQKLKGL